MLADTTFNISNPSDSDGFVLSQCSLCGELFKLTPNDLEDESQLQIWCPKCGLTLDSLITDEIKELAMKIVNNHVSDLLNEFGKDLNKSAKNGSLKSKLDSKIRKNSIDPIISRLDSLELQVYDCCHKDVKISPSLKMEGGYCPFCGEMQDGN